MAMSPSNAHDQDQFAALAAPIAERVGWKGVESISFAALKISGDHLPAYIGLMQLSVGLLDRLLACTNRRTALDVFAAAAGMAERHPAPALHFLQNSPDLFMLLGPKGAGSIAAVIDRTTPFKWEDAAMIAEAGSDHCRRLLKVAERRYVVAFWSLLQRIAGDRNASVLPLVRNGPALLEGLLQCKLPGTLFHLLGRAAERHPPVARHMLELSPALVQCFSLEELNRLTEIVLEVFAHHPETALKMLQSAPGLIERLPAEHPRTIMFDLYALAAQTVPEDPQLAQRLCEQSPQYLARIGLEGLQALIRFSLAAGRKSRPAALALWHVGCELVDRIGLEAAEKISRSAAAIAEACPETAAAFVLKSPGIVDRLGTEGLWEFADFCGRMAKGGAGMAARFPEQSLSLIDRLLARGDRRLVQTVYRMADRLGRRHPMIAHQMMGKSPELIDRIGIAGFEAFCSLAQDMARGSWTATDALIRTATGLIDCVGYRGLADMAAFSRLIARKNVFAALSLLEKSPMILERLVETGGPALAADVIGLAADAARADGTVAIALLEKSVSIIDRDDFDAFAHFARHCLRMAEQGSAAAAALVEAGAQILECTDRVTFARVADFWIEYGPNCGNDTAGWIKACPGLIEEIVTQGGPTLPGRVFHLVSEVAPHNLKAALNLLKQSNHYIAASGIEGLQKIAAQTVILTRIDPESAARFAAGESVAFADFMANIPQGLRLEEIRPILFNYLAALLGYRLEIEAGENPSIGAGKIVLPAKVREFQESEANFVYYKVMATHLEAHLEYGSFDLDVAQAQPLIRTVRHTYGSAEPVRDGELDDFYRLFPEPVMIRDLIEIFEGYRIDERLKREYPILGEQIVRMNRHNLKKRPNLSRIKNGKQHAVESIAQALLAAGPEAPAGITNDFQRSVLAQATPLQAETADFNHTLQVAAEHYFRFSDLCKEPYRPSAPEPNRAGDTQINQLIGNFGRTSRNIQQRLHSQPQQSGAHGPETKGAPSEDNPAPARRAPRQERVPHARRSAEGERPQLSAGAESDNDRQAHLSSEQRSDADSSSGMKFSSTAHIEQLLRRLYKHSGITPNEVEKKIRQLRPDQIDTLLHHMAADAQARGTLEKEKDSRLYGEWDDARQGYRENWCRVREQAMPEASLDFYLQTLGKYSGLLKKIRREFQMMRPEEWSRLTRQPDGDDIDLDAAVESMIDRKAGISPSENTYLRTEKKVRDIAVAVLVDMSKSTKGTTLRCEKEALIILSEALKEIGDTFALFGFSGDNRDNVDFYRIKDFEEPFHAPVQKKISAIDFGLENRDGTALRHTVGLLKGREERTKMIILISDGKPVDKEYAGRYAIEDTRKALVEAQKAGIKTFCITVDEKAADYLPRMYSHSNWVVIDDVTRLPGKISRIFARLTR